VVLRHRFRAKEHPIAFVLSTDQIGGILPEMPSALLPLGKWGVVHSAHAVYVLIRLFRVIGGSKYQT
jgi:hypothetical protein